MSIDPRSDLDALADRIATHAAHLDAATHTLLVDLRTFDTAGGWYKHGARSCAEWLAWRLGWGMGTAREHLRVARRLAELPVIDDALRRGAVSYCKVRAITRVATPANEALLLEDAEHATGAQLERICRKYAAVVRAAHEPEEGYDRERRYVRRVDLDDGMVKLEAMLHPEEAATVWAALEAVARTRREPAPSTPADSTPATSAPTTSTPTTSASTSNASTSNASTSNAATTNASTSNASTTSTSPAKAPTTIEPTTSASTSSGSTTSAPTTSATTTPTTNRPTAKDRRFDRAEALVAIARDILRGERVHAVPTELVVTVSAETLAGVGVDPIAVTADGTCISAETARRLACDCGVVHLVEGADGTPLSVGRKTRTIPTSIKRALLQRDTTCRFPGCCNRVFVEGHHIEHWAAGGETSLDNLVGVCSYHHRFVHEYGYRVELDELQQPRFFDRRGQVVTEAVERPRPRPLGMPALIEAYAELDISAETNEPRWDGMPVNYEWVIDDLVRADGLH